MWNALIYWVVDENEIVEESLLSIFIYKGAYVASSLLPSLLMDIIIKYKSP